MSNTRASEGWTNFRGAEHHACPTAEGADQRGGWSAVGDPAIHGGHDRLHVRAGLPRKLAGQLERHVRKRLPGSRDPRSPRRGVMAIAMLSIPGAMHPDDEPSVRALGVGAAARRLGRRGSPLLHERSRDLPGLHCRQKGVTNCLQSLPRPRMQVRRRARRDWRQQRRRGGPTGSHEPPSTFPRTRSPTRRSRFLACVQSLPARKQPPPLAALARTFGILAECGDDLQENPLVRRQLKLG